MMNYGVWSDMENTTISDLSFRLIQNVLKQPGKMIVSMDYLKRDFDFFNRSEISPLDEIERVHILQLTLHYQQRIGTSYSIEGSFNPAISSTWTSSLTSEDVLWNFRDMYQKSGWIKGKEPIP